ncbi:three component ABC system middle component [Streptomyces sp. NPDC097617]|uniref:three component ABC system middle component n=1 Tax=Streptomyces sp. NPDC097617 TaxID=3366091 RepID=UPI0037FA2F94
MTTTPRAPEAQALFNHPFGAYLLACAVHAAAKTGPRRPMPWPSAFLVLPFILPQDIRDDLPIKASRPLAAWLADHPRHRAQFPARAASLAEYTRASLRTALRHRALTVTEGGRLSCPRPPRPVTADVGPEVVDCARRAALVGRWLSVIEPATAYTHLGVRP